MTPRWLIPLWVLLLTGCATGVPVGHRFVAGDIRYRPATPRDAPVTQVRVQAWEQDVGLNSGGGGGVGGPAALLARTAMGAVEEADAFKELLSRAGLDDLDDLPPHEDPLTPEDAALLYDALLAKPVTLAGLGPRRVAFHLLAEAMEGEEELSRAALGKRLERYRFLAVLRPDGYLAWAVSGRTQQRVAPLEWKDGTFRAGNFEVGSFYQGLPGMAFFPVDEALERTGTVPLAEVYDDADVINRALDGAAEAYFELALATGHFLTYPLDSLAALSKLPEGVAALIASSPGYFERFRLMTRGEQIQAISKLTTALLATRGAAVGTTRTLAAASRALPTTVPALTVSAEGALVVTRVAVPVGRVATALSGGPGVALILHRANEAGQGSSPAPSKGPGQWAPAHESMSRRAARYQQQISGRPVEEAYWVGGMNPKAGGVRFDGFQDGVLLEAKGPGYANKFLDTLEPKPWFKNSGAEQLRQQALRQLRAVKGVPIRWHVAEKKAADAIRELLDGAKIRGVEVVHTPALP